MSGWSPDKGAVVGGLPTRSKLSYLLDAGSETEPDVGDWLLTAAGSAYEIENVIPSERRERLFSLHVIRHGRGWDRDRIWIERGIGAAHVFTLRWGRGR